MNKILILGHQGGLGQAFLDVYKDEQVIGLDRTEIDIGNQVQVAASINKIKPTLVINCAAYTNVDKAEQEPEIAESINGYAPGYIASACQQIGATFVHFSTGMVFDGQNEKGYNEDAIPGPVNAYGKSKLMGEVALAANVQQFYLVRSAWLFGQPKAGKKSFIEIMLDLASKNQPIKGVGDEFGTPTYDLDLAQATRALVEEKKSFGIYHLINSGRASRWDWAQEIFRIKNIPVKLERVTSAEFPPRPAKRLKYEVLNNTKFIKLRPWQEALKEFLNS